MNIATFYALAGEDVLAMEWLEHAVAQQDQNVPYIGVIPVFRKLHGDPRFQALARRVGVPLVALPRRVTTLED